MLLLLFSPGASVARIYRGRGVKPRKKTDSELFYEELGRKFERRPPVVETTAPILASVSVLGRTKLANHLVSASIISFPELKLPSPLLVSSDEEIPDEILLLAFF